VSAIELGEDSSISFPFVSDQTRHWRLRKAQRTLSFGRKKVASQEGYTLILDVRDDGSLPAMIIQETGLPSAGDPHLIREITVSDPGSARRFDTSASLANPNISLDRFLPFSLVSIAVALINSWTEHWSIGFMVQPAENPSTPSLQLSYGGFYA